MKFKTLNNREIRLEILPSHYPMRSRSQSKSLGQYNLGRSLRTVYGAYAVILEEFPIPEERLFLDFYLPHHALAFEFQGLQHDVFNEFFHVDKKGFERSLARDNRKLMWCQVNNIILVQVRRSLSVPQLKSVIAESRETNNE